jgi:hypothetical protein
VKNCEVSLTHGSGANGDVVVHDDVRAGTAAVARTATREPLAILRAFRNVPEAFVRRAKFLVPIRTATVRPAMP